MTQEQYDEICALLAEVEDQADSVTEYVIEARRQMEFHPDEASPDLALKYARSAKLILEETAAKLNQAIEALEKTA